MIPPPPRLFFVDKKFLFFYHGNQNSELFLFLLFNLCWLAALSTSACMAWQQQQEGRNFFPLQCQLDFSITEAFARPTKKKAIFLNSKY